jgi:hypothetical protein
MRLRGWQLALLAFYLVSVACSSLTHESNGTAFAPSPSIVTQGVAPAPSIPPLRPYLRANDARFAALASRAVDCPHAQTNNTIGGVLFIGCYGGEVVALNADRRIVAKAQASMWGINAIIPAGERAVAVIGYNDGASLTNALEFLRLRRLAPIGPHLMTDSTFLGVIGDRAYVDDWCCNGRGDVYRPATIYWIALSDGSQGAPVDLAPDRTINSRTIQPLGQGEHNYLIGKSLYVVVGPVTYRYDILDLSAAPSRMATSPAVSR